MSLLVAKNLSKTFLFPEKVELFSDLSLTVHPNTSVAITGRSGEGKTTLLHILGTLESFDSGSLSILGEKNTSAAFRNEHIGFIFQAYNLLEDFTALENVLMPARIGRKKVSEDYGLELLHLVGLEKRAFFPAKLLSGGEKQRVAIARAFCNNPDLILADEVVGNLDSTHAEIVLHFLFTLVKEKGKTLILVTHDQQLASRCDMQYELVNKNLKKSAFN